MERRHFFLLVALTLAAAVYGQDDCDDDYPPPPDLVPRIPGSTPCSGFFCRAGVLGQACIGDGTGECGITRYCETTTQACQNRVPLGSECDPSLFIQNCFTENGGEFGSGASCVAQANGRGKCVPRLSIGDSCADPAVGGCEVPAACDAGICASVAENTRNDGVKLSFLATCASDADCIDDYLCRATLDGRKRCLLLESEIPVGTPGCAGADEVLISIFARSSKKCPVGSICDARTSRCLPERATAALGEICSEEGDFSQTVLCESGDSATQAFCPNLQDEESLCELDLVGKRCGGDEDCVSGDTKRFECDLGVCARIASITGAFGITKGHLGSCEEDFQCYVNDPVPNLRCVLADDGTNRCVQARQIGDSCATIGGLVRDFYCAEGTRCNAASQTCVRDVPAVGVGQPCGTSEGIQFVACAGGTSCGLQVNSDGFRECV